MWTVVADMQAESPEFGGRLRDSCPSLFRWRSANSHNWDWEAHFIINIIIVVVALSLPLGAIIYNARLCDRKSNR